MNGEKEKVFQGLHFVLGIFFVVGGFIAVMQAAYLVGIWVIALGILFLFLTYQEKFQNRIGHSPTKAIHTIIALIVIIAGTAALLTEFNIL